MIRNGPMRRIALGIVALLVLLVGVSGCCIWDDSFEAEYYDRLREYERWRESNPDVRSNGGLI
jgi:hypothetical protein